MRAVVQLVKKASVSVDEEIISSIDDGLLVLLGINQDDVANDIKYIIDKLINMRIFRDENDKMNNSINSINGEILVVSQFTLYGDARKGRRPSYSNAASGGIAIDLYQSFIQQLREAYLPELIKEGRFGAMMDVNLINNGPVTILLDSRKSF